MALRSADIHTVQSPVDIEKTHTQIEIGNVFRCCKIEKAWLEVHEHPRSASFIRQLHAVLFENVPEYQRKGMSENQPGVYRKDDLIVLGQPGNFYARGTDVAPLMSDYTRQLDSILMGLSRNPHTRPETSIKQAAWAYYTFIRIHPFLDGNGRVGRAISSRVLRGAGFRDIIFPQEAVHSSKRFDSARNIHLDTMDRIGYTGNLAYLELFLARLLIQRYRRENSADALIYTDLQKVIRDKEVEVNFQDTPKSLASIWEKFGNIDIADTQELAHIPSK